MCLKKISQFLCSIGIHRYKIYAIKFLEETGDSNYNRDYIEYYRCGVCGKEIEKLIIR